MKKLAFIILLFFSSSCFGQNLVPNPSFEVFSNCPTISWSIPYLQFWNIPANHIGSTDYINACDSTFTLGVPQNNGGFQYARTGNGYIGQYIGHIYLSPTVYREYLQVRLIQPLMAGVTYRVGAYISLGDNSYFYSDQYGFHLSDSAIGSDPVLHYLPVVPQVESSGNYFQNDSEWTFIGGQYIATGGEEYLTIGNFRHDSLTGAIPTGFTGNILAGTYVFIDDVVVEEMNPLAVPPPIDSDVNVYPTVLSSGQEITVESIDKSGSQQLITVLDMMGREVFRDSFTIDQKASTRKIQSEGVLPGLYWIVVRTDDITQSFKVQIR